MFYCSMQTVYKIDFTQNIHENPAGLILRLLPPSQLRSCITAYNSCLTLGIREFKRRKYTCSGLFDVLAKMASQKRVLLQFGDHNHCIDVPSASQSSKSEQELLIERVRDVYFCHQTAQYSRKVKRPAVAGYRTQDTWLVQPVLCH